MSIYFASCFTLFQLSDYSWRQSIAYSQTVQIFFVVFKESKIDQETIESEIFDSLNSVLFFDVIGIFAKFA